ncbi:potassium ion transporter Trk2 [Schizosaccharomyces japonicus yFS275]|uniref:Potassium transport protein n=1 Tax=Schizosaccharomyces japonicus (strain yFS275 / FY16936) TaxID=402676 RepID=B6K1F6_SCHJY|nr:potassium ion transporter Trk2 [Schizosaccharomyces japonicus yFS275]EEB07777.1 potassium ion transporter Trk2 [Schizosaccharomyces japonicus yFS275]
MKKNLRRLLTDKLSFRNIWRYLRSRTSFLELHYAFIVGNIILGSVILYCSGHLRYIDALMLVSGACTQSGIAPVNLSSLSTYQQVTLFIFSAFTNVIAVNLGLSCFKLFFYHKRYDAVMLNNRLHMTYTKNTITEPATQNKSVGKRKIRVLLEQGNQFHRSVAPQNFRDEEERQWEMNRPVTHDYEADLGTSSSPYGSRYDGSRNPSLTTVVSNPEPERTITFGGETRQRTASEDTEKSRESPSIRRDYAIQNHRRRKLSLASLPARFTRSFTSAVSRRFQPRNRNRVRSDETVRESLPYLSYTPTIGRNSAFYALSPEEREELAGMEYRALQSLVVILVAYLAFFYIFGFVSLLVFIYVAKVSYRLLTDRRINHGWWAFFTSSSMFHNVGYTLTDDSLNSFQKAIFPQLLGTALLFAGNNLFPVLLRMCIWVSRRLLPKNSQYVQSLTFLLEHPRRSFTLLFPPDTTRVLFWQIFWLNAITFALFLLLNVNNAYVRTIPVGYRIVNSIFQNACTRSGGFTVVDVALIAPAVITVYMFMMYISAYVALSIRRTNVYEERSLGIYTPPESTNENGDGSQNHHRSFLLTHVRRQLSHDLWYLFLGFFIICIVEGGRLERAEEPSFNLFAVLFEVVSGYGTVGLSLGYPNAPSLSAEFKILSKLVMIALEIRGRHRGLPNQLDKAVLMPSDKNFDKEEEDFLRKNGQPSLRHLRPPQD